MVGRAPSAGGLLGQSDARAVDLRETGLEVGVRDARKVIQIAEIGAIEALDAGGKVTRYAEVDQQEWPAGTAGGYLPKRDGVEQGTVDGRTAHNHVVRMGLTEGVGQSKRRAGKFLRQRPGVLERTRRNRNLGGAARNKRLHHLTSDVTRAEDEHASVGQ